jgi:hypothetical protein
MNNISVALNLRSLLCLHGPVFLLRIYDVSQQVSSEYLGYSMVDRTLQRFW